MDLLCYEGRWVVVKGGKITLLLFKTCEKGAGI